MAKLIFTSRYVRDVPPEQLKNYVQYIGTREGVEKIDESKKNLPATVAQKKLICQILKDLPDAKDMLEYEDYRFHRTIGNASEFITQALEQYLNVAAMKKNYVDYLANRPRVERIGEHGLFTDAGEPVILSKVQEEVAKHQGPVWTHVVSLRREDAVRLGYDSGKEWMSLLRSKRAMLCKNMKIDSADLKWYAAFHNESYHPHIHIMVYSKKDNDGYLSKVGIEAMRSELAHSIFRQDFAQAYEGQNDARRELKEMAEQRMQEMIAEMEQGLCDNPVVAEKLLLLSKRLANTSGKKVYGYLKADVKSIVDGIVDELEKEPLVKEAYEAWGKWQNEILATYGGPITELPPLSRQKQFKSIKNMVIAEATKLGSHRFSLEEQEVLSADADSDLDGEDTGDILEKAFEMEEAQAGFAEWNDAYKKARQYRYGTDGVEKNYKMAFQLLCAEAKKGNAYACHDLGQMYAVGIGGGKDLKLSQEWYEKALCIFQFAEQRSQEREKPYLQYRIGKLYASGFGTEQDYMEAAEWFEKAVLSNHKYAQYSLAGLYRHGHGVEQNERKAFELYKRSADLGNAYAIYETAKMLNAGIGTDVQTELAQEYFSRAFSAFQSMEQNSHDDKLQYRLGQMLYMGTGTEADLEQAMFYWMEAVKQENKDAQYALGKHWLKTGTGDLQRAVEWVEEAAEAGNPYACYVLGKIYLQGLPEVSPDRERARTYLQEAAYQGNPYAQFLLDHMDRGYQPDVFLAATRLMHQLAKLFQEDYRKGTGGTGMHIDRKRRRKLQEKREAHGHKKDDHEPQQNFYG